MAEMEAGQKIKAEFMEENELTKLTFENMLNQYKLQIDFLESILDTLKKWKVAIVLLRNYVFN